MQNIVDKEREINRTLQEENIEFKLKLGQTGMEKTEAEPGKSTNKKINATQKNSIVYEEINSKESKVRFKPKNKEEK